MHFKVKLRLSEKFQWMGYVSAIISIFEKWQSIMLYSPYPAGGRNHPKYRIAILQFQSLLEVPFLEGIDTTQWKRRLTFLLPCSWMLILHNFSLMCPCSGWGFKFYWALLQFLFGMDSSLLISTVFHYDSVERQWKNKWSPIWWNSKE